MELLNCSNVTIEGFSSDTLNPAYSQGRVADVNVASDFIVVDVEDGFPLPTAEGSVLFNQTCPDGDPGFCGEIKIIYWDNSTRLMYQGQQMQVRWPTSFSWCCTLDGKSTGFLSVGPTWKRQLPRAEVHRLCSEPNQLGSARRGTRHDLTSGFCITFPYSDLL